MPIHEDLFRRVLRSVATPVSVVTTLDEQGPHGSTVSAFCSLSLSPPLVMVALDRGSELLALVRRSGRYAVNVLAREQARLARQFAGKGRGKFAGVEWSERDGVPVLAGVRGWLVCEVSEMVPGGDHLIVVGCVLDGGSREAEPLVYHERTLWALAEQPEEGGEVERSGG